MKIAFGVIVCLVVSICGLNLVGSVRPDLYPDLLDFGFIGVIIIGTAPFLFVAVVHVLNTLWQEKKRNRKYILILLSIIALTFALLITRIPIRVAFAASHTQLEDLLNDLPESDSWQITIDRKIGWFYIADYEEDYEIEEDGRVYLIADKRGNGSVIVTHGFCYGTEVDCLNPNESTDYEGEDYKALRVGEGWYWFRFSENW